jgi:hypothetical protein
MAGPRSATIRGEVPKAGKRLYNRFAITYNPIVTMDQAASIDQGDTAGAQHSMNLFSVFFQTLARPDYKAKLRRLP